MRSGSGEPISRRVLRVTYKYSACVEIRSADVSILCDPWFSEGIYDGAWFHYPPFPDALDRIPACDLVWVSHIHPDHYDPAFLGPYLDRHPATRVVIADFAENFLSRCMTRDGIPHEIAGELRFGDTRVGLFPQEIDSALAVECSGESVVNMNDCVQHSEQLAAIRGWLGQRPDLALLGYTGAGPWPQTYYDEPQQLAKKAEEKKQAFFDRYRSLRDALSPRAVVPFAGKYLLGGRLHGLNRFRGVADAVEVTAFDPAAIVLADGGEAWVEAGPLEPSAVRDQAYDPDDLEEYAESLADRKMDWEVDFAGLSCERIPFRRLLPAAWQRARERATGARDHYFCIRLPGGWYVANARRGAETVGFRDRVDDLEPRSEITTDPRHLFGLLAGVYHWNNAEVGSQYQTRRTPPSLDRTAQSFLNFFHI